MKKKLKQSAIGKIPKDWKVTKLGEIALDFISGGTPSTKNAGYWDGNIPWMTSAHIEGKSVCNGMKYITEEGLNNSATKIIPKNSILVTSRVGIGKIAINLVDIAISQDLTGIVLNAKHVDVDFLYWLLSNYTVRLKTMAQGSTIKGLLRKELEKFEIPLPSFPEQRKIAEILSTVDEAIEKVDEAIEKTERLKNGLMQELLTKGIGHKEFKDTEIGIIPKEWEVVRLSSIFNIIDGDRGKNYPNSSELLEQGHCLFLNAKNVTSKGMRFEDNQFISEEKDQKLRKGKLKRGDIVITTRGTVGNIGMYDSGVRYDHIRINSGMVIIRNKGGDINFDFYTNYLQSNVFQRQVERIAYGSAQPQLSVKVIKNMYVLEFDEVEQKEIVAIMKSENMKIELQKKRKENLERIKQGLMNDLLTGKRRVKII